MTVRIIAADVFEGLSKIEDESVDCVVTSPPYWGLRDYGVPGQIGLEPTLGEHLAVMVRLFREVRRVLKDSGTVWLNYGDCYATTPNGRSAAATKDSGDDDRGFVDKPISTVGPIFSPDHESGDRRGAGHSKQHRNNGSNNTGRIVAGGYLKPKDLCMVPNRLAIALQEDGWWIRSEIIWAKPNPMPESVTDRPASSHEKIFLLSKSGRYSYDAAAIRQGPNGVGAAAAGYQKPNSPDKIKSPYGQGFSEPTKKRGHVRPHNGFNERWDKMSGAEQRANGRNLRNWEPAPVEVWKVATRPFKGAHFATFPPELVERCLVAASSPGDMILDPFGGAGTTGLVADYMGRNATLIELNPEYVDLATGRLKASLVSVEADTANHEHDAIDAPLFSGKI